MSAEEKGTINSAVDNLKKAIEGDDTEKMKAAKDALLKEVQEFSARLYSQAESADSTSGQQSENSHSQETGETVDAEFSDHGQA